MNPASQIKASALARIFSATVLKEIANNGQSPALARLIRQSGLLFDQKSSSDLGHLFEEAFSQLTLTENRHEYVYKAAITHKILLGIHSLKTSSMATEFRVGGCKADVVIFNGTSTAYEVKSERDNLTRLPKQLEEYSKVFSSVNVIVGEKHIDSVKKSVQDHVGILSLNKKNRITTERPSIANRERTESLSIFNAINQKEAQLILKDNDVEIPNVPNTQRYQLLAELFGSLDSARAHDGMVKHLKITRELQSMEKFLEHVPRSLYTAVLTAKLNSKQQLRLKKALQTPISAAAQWG